MLFSKDICKDKDLGDEGLQWCNDDALFFRNEEERDNGLDNLNNHTMV